MAYKHIDNIVIENAEILFRNFAGAETKYNRAGNRNFCVIIDDEEYAQKLREEGWNVRIKPPRDEDDSPFMYLPVKVKFNDRGPAVYLKTGDSVNRLDEGSVSMLDRIDISSVDMDLRPYDWDVNGKTGRTAYLQSINVIQDIDRFSARYAEEEYPED